jgi:acetylornithine deacetylase/succinyl-diaminopimelate desuccinylase-like protein
MPRIPLQASVIAAVILLAYPAAAQELTPHQQLGRELLSELIGTNTTVSQGISVATRRLATRLRAAGFAESDVQLVGPNEKNLNLVVRYRGRGRGRPILFFGHMDVVEARREDWTYDPFSLTERDGYFYGRGVLDMKGGDASLVATLIRLRREGFVPDRDLIVALTAGEETGDDNGVEWLIGHRRDLIDAEYAINLDSGGGELRGGRLTTMDVQAAEKVYLSFALTVRNAGGHSSLPTRDNAIYRLAAALDRLSRHEFPARLSEITRAYFDRMSGVSQGQLGTDMRAASRGDTSAMRRLSDSPFYNALLRTTCVPTQLEGGHAENALPQLARAVVNCRLLPDEDTASVRRVLEQVVADSQVVIAPVAPAVLSPASTPTAALLNTIGRVTASVWTELPVVPFMETGATDGLFLRNAGIPVYGVTGIYVDVDDIRAHGRDERILTRSYYEGLEFTYRLMKALAAG